MKQKDIILIAVVVLISGVVASVISKSLITAPKNRQQRVEVVDPITPEFNQPDPKYFNTDSIDPTKLIKIGDNTNPTPFNGQ